MGVVANVQINVDSRGAIGQLNRVQSAAKGLDRTFDKVQVAAGRLQASLAGIGLTLIAKQTISAAASFNDLQTRLRLLTEEYGEYKQAQDLVTRSAKLFGLSNREAAEGITDIFARLRPLGVSLKDIESTFIGFNTVAKLSGVNAFAASAAFTQLAQALGSGALRGDEFNSIAEQVPGLLTAVAQETGIAQGKLRAYAAEGKITSDKVIRALKRVEREGASKIKKLIEESDVQKFKEFRDATDELSVAIGQKLLPAVTPLVELLTDLISGFADLPEPVQATAIAIFGVGTAAAFAGPLVATLAGGIKALAGGAVLGAAIQGLATLSGVTTTTVTGFNLAGGAITATTTKITAATVAAGLLKGALIALPFVAVAGAATYFITNLIQAKQEQDDFNSILETGTKKQLEAALAIERTNLARAQSFKLQGRGEGRAAFQAPIDRAELRIKQLEAMLLGVGVVDKPTTPNLPTLNLPSGDEDGKKSKFKVPGFSESGLDPVLQAERAFASQVINIARGNELLQARLSGTEDEVTQQQEIERILEATGFKEADRINAARETLEVLFNQSNELENQIKKQEELEEKQKAAAENLKQIYGEIGQQISTSIVDALTSAVDSTKSLADVATDLLRNIGRLLLQLGVNTALSATRLPLFKGLPGFANGGRPPVNKPSIVGERGPELFVPRSSGTIIPNDKMTSGSSNVVVNVDATGSKVEGDNNQASQLGKVIGAAVQAELVKQKRPGGLLAGV